MLVDTHAYCLHSQNYKETSALLTLLTRECGKITVLAKGIKRSKSKLKLAIIKFTPFVAQIKLARNNDGLAILISVDCTSYLQRQTYTYELQLSLFYANEIIYKLLPQLAADDDFYKEYNTLINEIEQSNLEICMRRLEMQLLNVLGHGIQLEVDNNGLPISVDSFYFLEAMSAPVLIKAVGIYGDNNINIYNGQDLINIANNFNKWGKRDLLVLKKIMRLNIEHCLNGKVLQSRKLFLDYVRMRKL